MKPGAKSPATLPSHAEARALIGRARRLRAETLARLLRAAGSRIAHRPAGAPKGAMPHARA